MLLWNGRKITLFICLILSGLRILLFIWGPPGVVNFYGSHLILWVIMIMMLVSVVTDVFKLCNSAYDVILLV